MLTESKLAKGNMTGRLLCPKRLKTPATIVNFHIRLFCPSNWLILNQFTEHPTPNSMCALEQLIRMSSEAV